MDKIVYEGQWLNCLVSENGWEYVSRKPFATYKDGNTKPDAVVIVPMRIGEYENELVMIKEFRTPIGKEVIGFPAGLIDVGETVVDAAIRELREETGLQTYCVLHESPLLFSSEGLSDESVVVVYLLVEGTPSREFLEENEDIETVIWTREQAEKALSHNPAIGKVAYFVLHDFVNSGLNWAFKSYLGI